ncbi:MAG: ABC transporter ATP-binding protein [Flavobacteriaceae bacterium]
MITTIKKLLFFLSYRERIKALGLLIMIMVMAFLDLVGVASILPFMSTLTNPKLIESNKFLKYLYDFFNFSDTQNFLFFLGILVLGTLIISLAFKALTSYQQLKFNQIREFTISQKLINNYLLQPYSWFLNKNSADVGNNLLKEVNQVVVGAMGPVMNIAAQSLTAISMIFLIIIINPKLALISTIVLSTTYGCLYYALRGYLLQIGSKRVQFSQSKHKVINEAFYGIKELKARGLEKVYCELFSIPAEKYARLNSKMQVLMQLPRYAVEAVCFGGIILSVLILMKSQGGLISSLPVLAVYSFAGYRIIPALQLIYANSVQLRSSIPSLDLLYGDITQLPRIKDGENKFKEVKLLNEIRIKDLSFTYPFTKSKILKNINLSIPVNKTVALVGTSGSGKTTTADLILGLFQPDSGKIHVDNIEINKSNVLSWQKKIGYVPQQIFLTDDDISSNIAFGEKKENIDLIQLKKVAKIANLHDFINNKLPDGYSTIIGEHGVRLSGGQRQRIGIARALYFNPQLLILDEATSALDNNTEQVFLDALKKLSGKITILVIAHRVSSIKDTDSIYLMDQGEVIANGSYKELLARNKKFQKFINHN